MSIQIVNAKAASTRYSCNSGALYLLLRVIREGVRKVLSSNGSLLRDDRTVDGVGGYVNLLSGLGRIHHLRSVPWSDRLRTDRGSSIESAGGLSRGLGIIILSAGGDVVAVCAGALIAALRSGLEAIAEIWSE